MRSLFTVGLFGIGALTMSVAYSGTASAQGQATAQAASAGHLNQMITLHEKNLPVFGITHPSTGRGGGGGGRGGGGGQGRGRGGAAAGAAGAAAGAVATSGTAAGSVTTPPPAAAPPPPPPAPVDLAAVAKETFAYKGADYNYASGTNDAFLQYMKELTAVGGSVRTHPFISKTPNWKSNADAFVLQTARQLNAGHVGIMMQAVESPEEIKAGIAAMRFKSVGGTRPDSGFEAAAAYWGLTPAEYKQKADVWPLNKNGELIVWAIIESRVGLDRVREIAATPGITVLWVGWGTLDGLVGRDQVAREAEAAKVLAACKEFKLACGFPAANPAEITARMAQGWNVFVMQSRNENGFAAIETGKKLGGR